MKIGDRIRINTLEDEEYYGQYGSIVAFSEGPFPYVVHLDQDDGKPFMDEGGNWYLDEERTIEMTRDKEKTIISTHCIILLEKEEVILIDSVEKVNLKVKLPRI